MLCSRCNRDMKIVAKGLCSTCYNLAKYKNNAPRINMTNAGRTCSADGCDKDAFAKGFCAKHYAKLVDHPCKFIWRVLRNRYGADNLPVSWGRFDGFIKDVGDRPTASHRLRRKDTSQPYSKENCSWVAPMNKKKGPDAAERSAYTRSWTLKRHFKLGEQEHAVLLASQNGVCAICKGEETHVIKRTGKIKQLAVDHCHDKDVVRGLLCSSCNIGLGAFNDDPVLLLTAVEYLKKHQD